MNRITKESLLAMAVASISSGTAVVTSNLTAGVVLILSGFALIAIRGYIKEL
jgi:hypothetical protein